MGQMDETTDDFFVNKEWGKYGLILRHWNIARALNVGKKSGGMPGAWTASGLRQLFWIRNIVKLFGYREKDLIFFFLH